MIRACLHGRGACADFTLKSTALSKTIPTEWLNLPLRSEGGSALTVCEDRLGLGQDGVEPAQRAVADLRGLIRRAARHLRMRRMRRGGLRQCCAAIEIERRDTPGCGQCIRAWCAMQPFTLMGDVGGALSASAGILSLSLSCLVDTLRWLPSPRRRWPGPRG